MNVNPYLGGYDDLRGLDAYLDSLGEVVTCPECGEDRNSKGDHCEHCGSGWNPQGSERGSSSAGFGPKAPSPERAV